MSLPKPNFVTCDETSLRLQFDKAAAEAAAQGKSYSLAIQYKEPHENWDRAGECPIKMSPSGEILLTEADVVDLKPGTPYFVRLKLNFDNGDPPILGAETVFDTKPVDCGSSKKKNKCIIS